MYWQRTFLKQGDSLPIGSYWREDLPKEGLLGSLQFHVRGTPVNDSMIASEKWRMLDFISKIEIIGNGSTPIKTVTGPIAAYLGWLDGGGGAPDKHFNYGTSTKRCHLNLNFGRRLFDPLYGLDLSKWNSVEVKVTNDGSATYFTGNLTIDAICYYLREPVEPGFSGYFDTQIWREWTTVADEKKYLKLEFANRLRRIVMQVIPDLDANNAAETTPYNVVDDVELYLRTGVLSVFDASLRELWYENYFDLGRDVLQALEPYTTDGKGIWTGLGQTLGAGGLRLNHAGAQSSYGTTLVPGLDSATLEREAATENDQDSLLVMGLALENCAVLRFDQADDPEQYLDPVKDRTVQLNVHTANAASAADGTVRVVVDQFVPA